MGERKRGRARGGPPAPRRPAALDAAAGAVAGAASRLALGPLDVVKIRLQVQLESGWNLGARGAPKYRGMGHALATIFREEGVRGLWRGTVPGLLLTAPYCAVQFVALQKFKELSRARGLDDPDGRLAAPLAFAAGAVAGVAATFASYPFDVLRTTLAAQGEPAVYAGPVAAARGIVRRRGLPGLYAGLGPTLVGIVPYAAIQFGVYDLLKRRAAAARAGGSVMGSGVRGAAGAGVGLGAGSEMGAGAGVGMEQLSPLSKFACGLCAGVVAKLATHPLEVVKKRFQVAGLARSLQYGARISTTQYKGLADCLLKIAMQEGPGGLFKGVVPSVAKAAPAAAITFTAYELVVTALLPLFAAPEAAGASESG